MTYTLKPKKWHYIPFIMLPLIVFTSLAVFFSAISQYSATSHSAMPGYPLPAEPSLAELFADMIQEYPVMLVQIVFLIAITPLIILAFYKTLCWRVTFDNTGFTFKGHTYTYQQIERIKMRGGKHGRIFYYVIIDGKCLFIYEAYYEGTKEFQFYLDFYKVPIVPYWHR